MAPGREYGTVVIYGREDDWGLYPFGRPIGVPVGWPLVNMRNRPDQAILDGTWTPPPVTRLGLAG